MRYIARSVSARNLFHFVWIGSGNFCSDSSLLDLITTNFVNFLNERIAPYMDMPKCKKVAGQKNELQILCTGSENVVGEGEFGSSNVVGNWE